MASRAIEPGGTSAFPLSVVLAVIPSLPRPLLSRLVARAIERLDEIDGDPDLEIEPDLSDSEGEEPDFHWWVRRVEVADL